MEQRKGVLLILSLLVLSLFLLFPEAFAQEGCPFCAKYENLGFPASYAERICALSIEHPEWEFEPLLITSLSREAGEEYDFETVVKKEMEVAERNLVFAEEEFQAYWLQGGKRYASGYYAASGEAIQYFLDPRNFLSEKGIFQFLILSGEMEVTADRVNKILKKSALEGLSLSEGNELGEALISMGEAWNINPFHLAVRLRQEQGEEGNALLWGTAGDILASLGQENSSDLNGFFNPFNISASGNSEEVIFRSGAEFAKKMGWDSLEKALWGGAEYLAQKYVLCYQNTLYLQKWNVDARSMEKGKSRNFWGQYMQNIGGAKTEAEAFYRALENAELIDGPLRFLIPVYEAMPAAAAPDPAKGECAAFAAENANSAPHPIPAALAVFAAEPKAKEEGKVLYAEREEGKGGTGLAWCAYPFFLLFFLVAACFFFQKRKKECFFW